MSVAAEVSFEAVQKELDAAHDYANSLGVDLDASSFSLTSLQLYAKFANANGEAFFAEVDLRDFPMFPPTIEFMSADRNQRASKKMYPNCFHPTPCVCVRYNRKAYQAHGGPHGDWRMLDWRLPSGSGVGIDSLAMMLSDLDAKIRASSGRLE